MTPQECKERYPALVWPNRDAPDEVWIRAALLRPRFACLLDFARAYGLPRLQSEWTALDEAQSEGVRQARPIVERILQNIATGFARATARH